jgi:hypothetical protein
MDSDKEAPVPAIKTPRTPGAIPLPRSLSSSQAAAHTATAIFAALSALHGLPDDEAELLTRAAAGARFIQSIGTYTNTDHELFRIALSELDRSDALTVEAAACYAAERVDRIDHALLSGRTRLTGLRVLWFAAILRLSDALCSHGSSGPDRVYATWTDTVLYVEFDGASMTDAQIARARDRVAALEASSGRRVVLASSAARRGAA